MVAVEELLEDSSLTKKKRKQLEKQIFDLSTRERVCLTFFTKTEKLVGNLWEILPELYNKIDTIVDELEKKKDVYIKVVERTSLPHGASGVTNVDCSSNSNHIYTSEYGQKTVSVRIADKRQVLLYLVHELGHVLYLVPNLKSYLDFYSKNYTDEYLAKHGYNSGHKTNDPSHQAVIILLKKFAKL